MQKVWSQKSKNYKKSPKKKDELPVKKKIYQ